MKHSVCRDLELRINNKNDVHKRTLEICINDQWHDATHSMLIANKSQSLPIMIVDSTSESVMLEWSGQPNNKNISGYDLSCTTSSLSDHGQIHEVRVPNISTSTTRVRVSGLLPGTAYQCCVNAHIQSRTNTPFDLISSNCVATSTITFTGTDSGFVSTESEFTTFSTISTEKEFIPIRTEIVSNHHGCLAIGLGTGLGIACLLLIGVIVINIIFLTVRLKKNTRKSTFKPSCTNE